MALGLQGYFRETASGLRRNGIVAFAAMSTAFIALFLFGLALLIAREFNLVIDAWTGNVEVAVYLTDPVNPDTVKLLTNKLEGLPAVADVRYESKEDACARARILFRDQPTFIENVDCATVFPASLRVKLADTAQFAQVRAIVEGQPGVAEIRDYRARSRRTARHRRLTPRRRHRRDWRALMSGERSEQATNLTPIPRPERRAQRVRP